VLYDAVQRFVSAVCFPADTILSLRADAESTVPIQFINYETHRGPEGKGELVCHVRGEAPDLDAAAHDLINAGIRNIQVFAVAANAAVLSPHHQVVYEPYPGGRFRALKTLGSDPQAARRMLSLDFALALLQALGRHPKEVRLLRAIENYGESLRRTQPVASVHAALHLWMAVENLTVVVRERLYRERGVTSISSLAAVLDVKPRAGRDYADERDVQGLIRRREIFDGDDVTYRALREASDGIEHGYLNFGDARRLVDEIFPRAAVAVRRSILRESGLPNDAVEALLSGIHTRPLPVWRPLLVAEGSFAADTAFDFDRPAHVRVEGEIQVDDIVPDEHATHASFDARVETHDGLSHVAHAIALDSPGELRTSPAED
jgi:hypothetical protein